MVKRKGGGLKTYAVKKARSQATRAVAKQSLKRVSHSSGSRNRVFPVLQALLQPRTLGQKWKGVSTAFWNAYGRVRSSQSKAPASAAARAAQRAVFRKQYASQLAHTAVLPNAGVAKRVYSIPRHTQRIPSAMRTLQSHLIKTQSTLKRTHRLLSKLNGKGGSLPRARPLRRRRSRRSRRRRK